MSRPEALNGDQIDLLGDLVNIPSYYNDQQGEKPCDESEMMSFIASRLSPLRGSGFDVWEQDVRGRRSKNVVVKKGKGTDFTLWLTGHCDTVRLEGARESSMKFKIHNDTMTGPGVGDMKMGIMGMIDVLERVPVPSRMTVIGAFLCDEEGNSLGARDFIHEHRNDIRIIPPPDLIFSPEIPTLTYPTRPEVVPITIARRGHAKYTGAIQVPRGHGAMGSSAPNSIGEYRHLLNYLEDAFRQSIGSVLEHPLLNRGDLIERAFEVRRKTTLSIPDRAKFELSQMIVESNIATAVADVLRLIDLFKDQEKYLDRLIHLSLGLSKEDTSYNPYVMDVEGSVNRRQAEMATKLAAVVDRVYEVDGRHHQFTGGRSTSDANVFAEAGWTIYECTGDARGEHSLDEQASSKGALRTIEIMEELVSGRFL